MTKSTTLRAVAVMAFPIVIANVSHTLVSLVDTLMVGTLRGVEDVPLAALGAATSVFLFLFLTFSSLVQGVQVLCARRLGEGRLTETGTVLQNGLFVGILFGIVATVSGLLLPEFLMQYFTPQGGGAEQAVLRATDAAEAAHWGGWTQSEISANYLHWRWALGMPMVILVFVFKGFYWGIGITRLDLAVSLVTNVVNIALNWVFIFGHLGAPHMGAPGAGLASALSNVVAIGIYVYLAARREFRSEYGTFARKPIDWAMVGQILRLSFARMIQGLAFGASAVFFAIIGREIGAQALAISTAIWRLFGILVLTGVGIGTAASTLVGRELGAGRPDLAELYTWASIRLGVLTTGILGLLAFILAPQILGAFNLQGAAIEIGAPILRLMALLQVVDACGIILSKALVGAGQVYFVMFAEIVVAWGVCIPICLMFLHLMADTSPLMGAWLGWVGYILAWAGLMLFQFKRGSWKQARI